MVIPYSQKYWQELNLAVGPKMYTSSHECTIALVMKNKIDQAQMRVLF